MKINVRTRVAAVAAAVAIGLAGCSSPSAPVEEANQTLRLSQSAPPANFSIGNWGGGDATLFNSIYDTLVRRTVSGEIEPSIAESWEYSDDRLTLTFHIRDGLKFTNGDVLDAKAVVASLEASRVGPATSGNLKAITKVEATDDSTVVLTLSKPDAALLPTFSGVHGGVGVPGLLKDESSKLDPIGSGPYILNKEKSTVGSVYALDRNPDHWNVDAYPYESLQVRVIQDPTASVNAMQSGQLDYTGVSGAEVVKQFDQSKFTSGNNKPSATGVLWLVDREGAIVPALKDVRVRQAINHAIDRKSIAERLNPGTNHPTAQYFSSIGKVYDESLNETYAYDVAKARKLMAEAGYADGFSVKMPSTVVSTPYESVLSQSLGDIGIKVEWETVPFQDFYAKVFGGSYGMFFMFNGFSGSDAQDAVATLGGIFNPKQQFPAELQQLMDEANRVAEDKQPEALRAVNEWLVKDAWAAPISNVGGFYVVPKTVNYTPPAQTGIGVEPFQPAK